MKSKKIFLVCAVCFVAAATVLINPGNVDIGTIISHPWACVRYIFPQ